ncbi:MAG: HNH endonuclease [Gammaproteobacteria bacterium]|nr:HNH endonuclease [Gammaproteobacteria bacterium]
MSRPKLRELKASTLTAIAPGIGGAIRSAHRRGLGGRDWLRVRRLVWTEQKGQCAACGTLGRPDQQELDHVHPIHLGGDDSRNNLQMLCKKCHASKTAQEQGARTRWGGGFSDSENEKGPNTPPTI